MTTLVLVSRLDTPETRASLRDFGPVGEIHEVGCNGCQLDVLVTDADIKTLMAEQPNVSSALILCLRCAQMRFPNYTMDSITHTPGYSALEQETLRAPLREIL